MSDPGHDAFEELGRLLESAGARPTVNRTRFAPSTLYDATYHVAVIACAFAVHADTSGGAARILAGWLKLLQFVAARPALAPALREYAESRRKGQDIMSWSKMPRGYLGDRTHDAVVDYLVASGVLRRGASHLESGPRFAVLQQLGSRIIEERLFVAERAALDELRAVRGTGVLLEGQ